MHAVEWEERVVRQLIRGIREHLLHTLWSAKELLGFRTHLVTVAVHPFAEEATDREVHRMIGRNAVHAPDMDFFLEQPGHEIRMRAGVHVDVLLLVRLLPELAVP